MALIEKRPRTATIVATNDCRLLRLESNQINARLASGDPLLGYWLQSLLKRLRHMQKLLQSHISPNMPTPPHLLTPESLPEAFRTAMINDFRMADELRQLMSKPAEDQKAPISNSNVKPGAAPGGKPGLPPGGRLDYVMVPIVDLKEHMIVALRIRPIWRHPTQGVIQARRIYELAHKMWLNPSLDLAIATFCSKNIPQIWKGRRIFTTQPDLLRLVLPVRSMLDDNAAVTTALQNLLEHLPPDRLILELEEERLAIANPEQMKRILAAWRDQGFRLMLSYSEGEAGVLQILRRHPIDYLRLRPELTTVLVSGRDAKLAENLSANFHRLSQGQGLQVWADGIESIAAEPVLRKLGIESGSGSLYARHLTLGETVNLLVEKRALVLPPAPPKPAAESK